MTSGRALLLLLAAAVVALGHARAAPLDVEQCAQLKGEHAQLELAGAKQDMAKGAEWAKANLALEKMERVRRFIELEEQLLFRCRDKSLVTLSPEQDPSSADDDNGQDKKKADPKAAKPPAAAKTAKPPAAAKTAKPPVAAKKKPEPARKVKPAPKQTKNNPGAVKTKPAAKAAVKQPSAVTGPPAAPKGKLPPKTEKE